MLDKKIYITAKGYTELEQELEFLRVVKRPELIERLQEAQEGGDWMDNTEQLIFQDKLGFVDGRIHDLEYMLAKAQIIEEPNGADGVVTLGSTVVIQVDGDEPETYTIVGVAESNPAAGLISNESPLGRALLNQEPGDDIAVETPGGTIVYRLIEVR